MAAFLECSKHLVFFLSMMTTTTAIPFLRLYYFTYPPCIHTYIGSLIPRHIMIMQPLGCNMSRICTSESVHFPTVSESRESRNIQLKLQFRKRIKGEKPTCKKPSSYQVEDKKPGKPSRFPAPFPTTKSTKAQNHESKNGSLQRRAPLYNPKLEKSETLSNPKPPKTKPRKASCMHRPLPSYGSAGSS